MVLFFTKLNYSVTIGSPSYRAIRNTLTIN